MFYINHRRKLFICKCYLFLWIGKQYIKFMQTFGCGFYTIPQDRREQKRIIKQAKHYNNHIIRPGGRYRSIVLAGRRF